MFPRQHTYVILVKNVAVFALVQRLSLSLKRKHLD